MWVCDLYCVECVAPVCHDRQLCQPLVESVHGITGVVELSVEVELTELAEPVKIAVLAQCDWRVCV